MRMRLGQIIVLIALTASQAWAVGAPVRIDGGDTITGQADVSVTTTVTLIKASNTSRAALNCTTTADVRWGHSTVTATTGQLLAAGASIAIQNTAAVYMIAESTTATVSCTEETWASVSSGSGVFSP
jgi:hypothetical protein